MAPPAEVLDLTAADVKEECRVKEEAENPTDIESLDAAIRALKRKRAALAAGSSAGGSTSQLPAKRIKRESTRFVPKGEVIDLT
ncbi:hypothetical protein ID866_10673 [Astraeus odoratus]|nr:hypothetical protein ID866_10673 [Astraeus odoratus]